MISCAVVCKCLVLYFRKFVHFYFETERSVNSRNQQVAIMSSNEQVNYNSDGVEGLPVVLNEENQSPSNIEVINDEDLNLEQFHDVPSIIDPVRQYMLQKHLVLLIHAQTCLEDESERNIPAANCRVAFCDVMRNVLKHLDTCLQGIDCTYELCSSSQLLLYHLENCGQRACPLCAPFVDIDVLLGSSDPENESPRQSSSDTENNHENNTNDGHRIRNNSVFNSQEANSSLAQILHSPNGIARWVENSRKMVQLNWQLFVLLHADKCRAHRSLLSCPTPNCQELRTALNHMPNCHSGRNCTFPHCWASRQIINHWTNCRLNICPLCVPIRQLEGVRNRNFFSSVILQSSRTRTPGTSSGPPPPLRPLMQNQPSSSHSVNNVRGHNLNSIPENDQIHGINGVQNNAPGVRGQETSDVSAYHTPLDISVNHNSSATSATGRSANNPLPLLIRVNHGASCSLSTSASGAIQLCSSAEHHYQQSGLIFSNPNPPTQTDVSPPGVRVGSLPGYGPDDISPPGVRIGSLPGYGPDDISPPSMRIGSTFGYNHETTVETNHNEEFESNQALLRVCSHDSSSASKIIDDYVHPDHLTTIKNSTTVRENFSQSTAEPDRLLDPSINKVATTNEPEMQSLTGTMSKLCVPETEAGKQLVDEKFPVPNDSSNLSIDTSSVINSGNVFDSTNVIKQHSSSDLEPIESSAKTVQNPKDCDQTTKSDPEKL